jgi:MoaA/NifB/PqqE/SkfB family radical SAM enzyme
VHLWEDKDFQNYEQQLADINDVNVQLQNSSKKKAFNLLNISDNHSTNGVTIRCSAGFGFVAIGPDSYIYPCPMFYHIGRQHAIGSVRNRTIELRKHSWDINQCCLCHSNRCPGCPYLELSQLSGKGKIWMSLSGIKPTFRKRKDM